MQKSNLDEFKIKGIARPKLIIKGWVYNKNYEIKICAGNKEIYKLYPNVIRQDVNFLMNESDTKATYGYDYELKLPMNSKKIKLYIETARKKNLIKEEQNNLLYKLVKIISVLVGRIISKIEALFNLIVKIVKFSWKEYHFLIPPRKMIKYFKIFKNKIMNEHYEYQEYNNPEIKKEYHNWIRKYETITEIKKMEYNPLISIVMPVYNVDETYLTECIESVLNQTYDNFELCIADDCSTKQETIDCLKKYENNSKIKIKYRRKNGHISEATNTAISLAKGEFIGLLDNDDVLRNTALYEIVNVLNNNKEIDMIYSDEDKLDLKGERVLPVFKPDWSPDTLMSHNYICHFAVIRKTLIDEISGFRKGVEGSQDFDLFLRISEKTDKIYHIPKILYHWRMIPTSTSMNIESKSYVTDRGVKVLEDALKRRELNGKVIRHNNHTFYSVKYDCPKNSSTTIFINYRSGQANLSICLREIFKNTHLENIEVIILNYTNNNISKIVNKYMNYNIKTIELKNVHNFSSIINDELLKTKSKFIAFLDGNCETRTNEWLEMMIGHASQKHIGAVGAKMTLGTTQILHGGMILGLKNKIAYNSNVGKQFFDDGTMFRLLVPTNFSCVSGSCLVFEKKKLKKLNEQLNYKYWDINLCLELLKTGYYNVLLPDVIVNKGNLQRIYQNEDTIFKIEDEKQYMKRKWKSLIENDPYYNINFDKNNEFMLKK